VITLGLMSGIKDAIEKAWKKLTADPAPFEILMSNLTNRLPFNVQLILHNLGVSFNGFDYQCTNFATVPRFWAAASHPIRGLRSRFSHPSLNPLKPFAHTSVKYNFVSINRFRHFVYICSCFPSPKQNFMLVRCSITTNEIITHAQGCYKWTLE
jgi:hypothetical protein